VLVLGGVWLQPASTGLQPIPRRWLTAGHISANSSTTDRRLGVLCAFRYAAATRVGALALAVAVGSVSWAWPAAASTPSGKTLTSVDITTGITAGTPAAAEPMRIRDQGVTSINQATRD
jgi:hypothetical protein